MHGRLKPRDQGQLGELSAIEWLGSIGAVVCIPVGHSPDFDLMVDIDGKPARVQVKTATYRTPKGRWHIILKTCGGNRSWTGTVKYFGPHRCDFLFVLVGDGRRWFIPAGAVEGRSGLVLGGPKYAEYEVERGRPISRPEAA